MIRHLAVRSSGFLPHKVGPEMPDATDSQPCPQGQDPPYSPEIDRKSTSTVSMAVAQTASPGR